MDAVVTTEREVSVPYAAPTPVPERHVAHAAGSALQRELATLLKRRADDIAARWAEQAGDWPPGAASSADGAPRSPHDARALQAVALVRSVAEGLAVGASSDEADALGRTIGASAFAAQAPLDVVVRGLDLLAAMCLRVIEEGVAGAAGDVARNAAPADVVRACRQLQAETAALNLAATCGYVEAADRALQERFRSLRHDLRNPLSTIRSALSLMADETVPEEARRSPRFRAMIERNTAALDQMLVARLSDAEAQLVPARGAEPSSATLGVGEARNDLARPRQREDRQAGSL